MSARAHVGGFMEPERGVGDQLAACGVGTVAIYMPGYHRSVDNDILWGAGWTEWE